MLAGIREILIITTPHEQNHFQQLLKDGSDLGVTFKYASQAEPKGLAQAFTIGNDFLSGDSCLMILGDNIFHGTGLGRDITKKLPTSGAHIFTYEVSNPSDYGILEVNEKGYPVSITEKPSNFISDLAVTGLYFFDGNVSAIAKGVTPSERGELEITSVIDHYLKSGNLTFSKISRGAAWLDTGTPNSMNDAATYIRVIEERTGLKIACLEEIAFGNNWITSEDLEQVINAMGKSDYGRYLKKILNYATT